MDYSKPEIVTSYHMSTLMSDAWGFASAAVCDTNFADAGGNGSPPCLDFGGPKSIYKDGDF